ncbi:MAG: restriction endonuclease subunit R [Pelodictyon luteolum]|uniref:Restriction endonuclease subunit R n=1 Tax=Pelodictyon luteolum TaxID=1100 RepID=A0A165MBF0_PELLU|nr:DUF3427 domain-containing protein [Pelodictyon luteolum]KZK75043.1 MAG: restriction endonuclease subunit R [Pelodictyon luteolum]
MSIFLDSLRGSMETGFIDRSHASRPDYQPSLLLNDSRRGVKVLGDVLNYMSVCEDFWLSVAFLTTSGIASIHNALRELEDRGVRGKILVSQYLNFTQPEALRGLLKFSNVDARLLDKKDYHGKGYLFKVKDGYSLIIGSSNLTGNALSKNAELNLRVVAAEESKLISDTRALFEEVYEDARPLTKELIDEYEIIFNQEQYSGSRSVLLLQEETAAILTPNSMQVEALSSLGNLREKGVTKALVVSATGTGKTVLAAFDAKSFGAKRVLFVIHRLNIAKKALETFQRVFGRSVKMGLYSGSERNIDADFVFSTVQTINNHEHLKRFHPEHFDYVIIDEAHRSGASSYHNVLEYFTPGFLLGMTATPERTDGYDIFSLFDHNIGYEIRLSKAMEEDLLSPFHYFGVADITVDEMLLDDTADFSLLVTEERVDRIVEAANEYGCDDGRVRGLVFCSRVEEAERLSVEFNRRGYRTVALSGRNSEEEREKAMDMLEADGDNSRLDYVFTVDIFNEGIDIPRVNQIIMLRPTQSAIIFVQQLGRGLRKAHGKEYLTVIDFIGNYKNNYMIPIALYGDVSFNKDILRKYLSSGSAFIPGASTVNFDKISKDQIFKAIDSANLQQKKGLINDYQLIKYRLGRMPYMADFLDFNSRDPFQFCEYSKSYYGFVRSVDKDLKIELPENDSKLLEHLSLEVNNGKRVEESLILRRLIAQESFAVEDLKDEVRSLFCYDVDDASVLSAINMVNLVFVTMQSEGKIVPIGTVLGYDVAVMKSGVVERGESLSRALKSFVFRDFLLDSAEYSIRSFHVKYAKTDFVAGFLRYEKYSRKDVFRVLNWAQNPVAQNVGGYIVSTDKTNCPIFVNYEKHSDISDSTKYEDEFINPSEFGWMSKSRRSLQSPDVMAIREYRENGMRLPLFIKKNNDEGLDFYYMGDLTPEDAGFVQDTMASGHSVVRVSFKLDKPVEDNLYRYLTDTVI